MTKTQAAMIRHILQDSDVRMSINRAIDAHALDEGCDQFELAEHQEAVNQLFTFIACHGLDYVAKGD